MKRIVISKLIATTAILLCSCGNCHADTIEKVQTVSIDTIHFHNQENIHNKIRRFEDDIDEDDVYDITFMIPNVSKELTENIKAKISEALGTQEKGDLRKMAQEASQKFFAMHKKEAKKGGKHYEPLAWSYYAVIELRCISPKYLTIGFEADDSRGGVHGLPYSGGWTFIRENGKILTWKDITSTPDKLLPLIEEGFGEYKEVWMKSIKSNNKKLKLPITNPWIERDALVFQYQAGEIALRAIGCPCSEVYVKALGDRISDDIVSPMVKDLINSYDAALDIQTEEEMAEPDEPTTLPLKIMYETFDESLKVDGTPNIEAFIKALPNYYNKDLGWFIHPLIDNANGYACYSEEGNGGFEMNAACWKRSDGKTLVIFSYNIAFFNTHKEHSGNFCLAENSKFYYVSANSYGDPADHSFIDDDTGFAVYLYDPNTKTLNKVNEPPFSDWENCTTNRFLILPQNGKDIKVRDGVEFDDVSQYTYHTLKWNGMTFDYKE